MRDAVLIATELIQGHSLRKACLQVYLQVTYMYFPIVFWMPLAYQTAGLVIRKHALRSEWPFIIIIMGCRLEACFSDGLL